MRPERLHTCRVDGVAIRVGEWLGPGDPILCLHGLTANLVSFSLAAQGLCPAHRVLAMDLRGRGRSDKPEHGYSLGRHCLDIIGVLGALGIAKAAIMGHSLGAYIGLALAARHPEVVERLVLLDGGGELSPEQWTKVGAAIAPAVMRLGKVSPSFEAYVEPMRRSPAFTPWNRTIEDYFRYEVEEVEGGVRSRVRPENIAEEQAGLAGVRPSALHPLVRCPVLILRATRGLLVDNDLVLPPDAVETMLGAFPDASVVSLPATDHYSILFQPNPERDQAILNFLAARRRTA